MRSQRGDRPRRTIAFSIHSRTCVRYPGSVGTWHDPDLGRPIAAPLERCAELLGVDLATIWEAASSVEPYLRVDGTRIWSLMQLERQHVSATCAVRSRSGSASALGRPRLGSRPPMLGSSLSWPRVSWPPIRADHGHQGQTSSPPKQEKWPTGWVRLVARSPKVGCWSWPDLDTGTGRVGAPRAGGAGQRGLGQPARWRRVRCQRRQPEAAGSDSPPSRPPIRP